jgi:hypothetical protein
MSAPAILSHSPVGGDHVPGRGACDASAVLPDTFEEHVAHRLATGEREYGDRSYARPLAELLAEQLEEAADLSAWGRIAADVLAQHDDLEPCEREEIAAALRCAENLAAQAWARLFDALQIVRAVSS